MKATSEALSKVIPLMRVTKNAQLLDMFKRAGTSSPCWNGTRDGAFARQVEIACGWERCVYLYAGQAYPLPGGEMAFAYAPAMERGKTGHALPCDTGGVYDGKCSPFRLGDSDPRPHPDAVGFLQSHSFPLQDWRQSLGDFLHGYFNHNLDDYCDGKPPNFNVRPSWGGEKLPARYPDNFFPKADWPSWTWEVRIEDEFPLQDGLLVWVVTPSAYDNLMNELVGTRGSVLPPDFATGLPGSIVLDNNFTAAVKEWSKAWVQDQL